MSNAQPSPKAPPPDSTAASIRLENRADAVSELLDFIQNFGLAHGLSDSVSNAFMLAAEELFINTVSYGYRDGAVHHITVRLSIEPGSLAMDLEDDGAAFDPFAREDPDITLAVEDRPIGGLGIFLTRQVMDQVAYERRDDRNWVSVQKKLGHPPAA